MVIWVLLTRGNCDQWIRSKVDFVRPDERVIVHELPQGKLSSHLGADEMRLRCENLSGRAAWLDLTYRYYLSILSRRILGLPGFANSLDFLFPESLMSLTYAARFLPALYSLRRERVRGTESGSQRRHQNCLPWSVSVPVHLSCLSL